MKKNLKKIAKQLSERIDAPDENQPLEARRRACAAEWPIGEANAQAGVWFGGGAVGGPCARGGGEGTRQAKEPTPC